MASSSLSWPGRYRRCITRLLRSLESDDISLNELAMLLERDPGLSAKVLRLANSARCNRRQAVASLRDAAARP